MVFITGDTHSELGRFYDSAFHCEPKPDKNDYVIVCGDFGFVFEPSGSPSYYDEMHKLRALAELPYTILFADGNHENFPRLQEYGTETKFGGKVRRIADNIYHLTRGQVFEIEGNKYFTMGGAYSRDRAMRREGISWWREELPSDAEYKEAIKNLAAHNNEVDCIVTHTAPGEVIRRMNRIPDPHEGELNGFFDYLMHEMKFKQWFFGHWHTDAAVYDKFRAVWFDVVPVPNKEIRQGEKI